MFCRSPFLGRRQEMMQGQINQAGWSGATCMCEVVKGHTACQAGLHPGMVLRHCCSQYAWHTRASARHGSGQPATRHSSTAL